MFKTFLSDLGRLPNFWMEKRKFWRLGRDGSITLKGEKGEYVKRLTTTDVEDDGLRVKLTALKEVYGLEFVIVKNSNWYFHEPTVVPVIIKDNKVYGLHTADDVDECGVAIPYRILRLFSSKIEMEKKLPPEKCLLEPHITSFLVSNLQPRAGWDEELTNILESMTGCAIYPYTVHLMAHKNRYEKPIAIPEFETLAELKMKMELSRNELGK